MSEHLPVCSARQVAAVLREHGFVLLGQKGSHQKWRSCDGRQVVVADHGSKEIPVGTLKSIIKSSGLGVSAFR